MTDPQMKALLRALRVDFDLNGYKAIDMLREYEPDTYASLMARLAPEILAAASANPIQVVISEQDVRL